MSPQSNLFFHINPVAIRIHNILVCSTFVFGMSIASIQAATADDAATKKAIDKQYSKIAQAVRNKKLKSLDTVFTPDYTVKTPEGQVITYQQLQANLGLRLSFLQKITDASAKISKLSVKGKEAVADVTQSFSGVIADPQTQGKVHKIVSSSRYKDTWIKSGDTWQCKRGEIVSTSMSMDGKKVDLANMMGSTPATVPGNIPTGATKQ